MRIFLRQILDGVEREAWVRFLLAIVGLALAFGTALLSTVFGESGNFIVSVVFAAFALILAAIVG
ncbi:MAG TPA: hypothetical protein VF135_05860, partial [Terriglobales bacterium]